jgi:uncharacterized small protein (DUF1192 family)
MSDSELDILTTRSLDRRIAERQTLTDEIAAWEANQNRIASKPTGNSQPTPPVKPNWLRH